MGFQAKFSRPREGPCDDLRPTSSQGDGSCAVHCTAIAGMQIAHAQFLLRGQATVAAACIHIASGKMPLLQMKPAPNKVGARAAWKICIHRGAVISSPA